MSTTTPQQRSESARNAALARFRRSDDPEVLELRRQFKAERLEAYIKQVVDEAPVLTIAQRDRLASLLRPGAA